MQSVSYTDVVVSIDADIFSVGGEVAQCRVVFAHFEGVTAGHVGRQQNAAEQRVDRGKLVLLLRGQLAVFLP